ncbi:MAG: carnitine-CoA ligase [Actinomycetota bacterium]|jgi:crotonobetaine/carnitine-CoA ligase
MRDDGVVLTNLLARRAADTPDQVFLQDVGGQQLTYGELQDRILRWAGALQEAGVTAGETVVTMLPASLEAFAVWLGIASLRAIEVPLNTSYRGPMLEHTVNTAAARLAVVTSAFVPQFDEVRSSLSSLERIIVPDGADEGFADDAVPAKDLEPAAYHDIACMIYTSGTSGPSKGVLMPWGELHQFVTSVPTDVLADDGVYYLCLPVFHVSGKSGIYICAEHEARMVVRETFSLTEFWNDIRTFGVTSTGLIGVMASFLMAMPEQADDGEHPLQHVTMGPLVAEVEDFKRRFGVKVSTGYGMTEIGVPMSSDGWNLANETSCGRVRTGYPGYEVRVVDEVDRALGPGQVGELIVRTAEPFTMNAGYYGMPAETAHAWRNGWFHTGDAFRYDDDGNFYFVDRIKDAIRRRGENISSFEVEAYVVKHPAVAECAAVGVPSEHSEDEVKVVVVPAPGASLDPAALIEFLIPTMPRFMIPRYVEVVDALPKTPTMRVRKVELRAGDADSVFGDGVWDREAAGIELPR